METKACQLTPLNNYSVGEYVLVKIEESYYRAQIIGLKEPKIRLYLTDMGSRKVCIHNIDFKKYNFLLTFLFLG